MVMHMSAHGTNFLRSSPTSLMSLAFAAKIIVVDKRFFGTKKEAPLMLTCKRKKKYISCGQ